MKKIHNLDKYILTIFFTFLLIIVGLKSSPHIVGSNLFELFIQKDQSEDIVNAGTQNTENVLTIDTIKNEYTNSMWLKSSWINLNGTMARFLDMKGYYGIYVTDGQYIVSNYMPTTTDYEYDQITNFKSYLDERGIDLLYINAPTKYTDDTLFANEFGIKSCGNQNADIFLQRINDAGIHNVDLRDEIKNENLNIYDMFYRTDHHWTTKTGLWATQKIVNALNQSCNFRIDTNIFDEANYNYTEYKNSWLGEQGRKLAVSYVGLDDYTLIEPQFDTSLVLTTSNGTTTEGSFDIMIDKSRYNTETDVYSTPSWHYSYLPIGINQSTIHNNNVSDGKILILGDSYSQVVVPFLSLGVADTTSLVLRSYKGSLREFIDANKFDAVVIVYAQFMIGAHDNPESANYDMFNFN